MIIPISSIPTVASTFFHFDSILSIKIINSISLLIPWIPSIVQERDFNSYFANSPNQTAKNHLIKKNYTTGKNFHDCQSWQLQQFSPVIPPICFVPFQCIVSFLENFLVQTAPLNLSVIPLLSSYLSIWLIPFSHFRAIIPWIPSVPSITRFHFYQF